MFELEYIDASAKPQQNINCVIFSYFQKIFVMMISKYMHLLFFEIFRYLLEYFLSSKDAQLSSMTCLILIRSNV